ncbi:hypothetical protein L6452_08170 [Arctium lappa]|uniref:Uncharacterized protein n=1 Tax=Arctium lappa TaxID=4217 RepID=A0ACB9DGI3_ARCLA|nr:hypothetical protein L6452_08170 [Arctium lappa]
MRFPKIRSVALKGKPSFSDFNLVPEDWGADVHPWLECYRERVRAHSGARVEKKGGDQSNRDEEGEGDEWRSREDE